MRRIHVIDSHTGGEPTRLVIDGAPDLGSGSMSERLALFKSQHDDFRSAVVCEPRGSDVLVGALLLEPVDRTCAAGVIFFNNVGYLGMCGHGTIGLMASLSYLGRLQPGVHKIETPVGIVEATIHPTSQSSTQLTYSTKVTIKNVPSYRKDKDVVIEVDGKKIRGDVAWGGNWFYLAHDHGLALETKNIDILTEFAWRVRSELDRRGITGDDGAVIDHIELNGESKIADSKGFMLCPGKAYDRSPCGTGTSAKLACLCADGVLNAGDIWRHEGIVGSVFEGRIEREGKAIIPIITAEAWVTSDAHLLIDERDPFANGIQA
jgi:4-hydroxyproline epimerase